MNGDTPPAAREPVDSPRHARTIAVTGASGWIGGRLCALAANRGITVRAVSRESLASVDALRRMLEGCDAVVHLAALVHQRADATPETRYADANVRLTQTVAEATAAAAVPRLIFVSSAKVIGDRTARPAIESDAMRPEDGYARSKRSAERLLVDASPGWPFEIVIVRPPLVYGPGVRANFLSLLRAADSRWPLPLAGAQAPRSMVYVDNLVDALLFICESPDAHGRTFFVSDDHDVSVAQLLDEIRRRLGRPRRLVHVWEPLLQALLRLAGTLGLAPAGSFGRLFVPLQVDVGALLALGWRPPVDFDEALAETVRWYRNR